MRVRALGATAVAIAAGTSVLAGCGTLSSAGGKAPGAPVAARACVRPSLAGPGKSFAITEQDNGKSYCVVAGTSMFVFLHSDPSRMWSPIHSTSAALQPRPSGVMTLARGVTGAYFFATRLGRATVESSRAPCAAASAAGATPCPAQTSFTVTVLVLGTA